MTFAILILSLTQNETQEIVLDIGGVHEEDILSYSLIHKPHDLSLEIDSNIQLTAIKNIWEETPLYGI